MPIENISGNIYRIPVPLPNNPLRTLNAYVIRGKDQSLLIDTGFCMEECRQALRLGLDELGIKQQETCVLLTHMHSDHAGLAPEFVGDGQPIFISAKDRALLDGYADRKSATHAKTASLFEAAGFPAELLKQIERINPAWAYAPAECHQYEAIQDGQMLEFGGYQLHCIAVPGHTPGQMCFYIAEEGIMFTGDHVLFDITPNITGWPWVKDSLGDYLDSLKRIREYEVRQALPGHRKPGIMRDRIDTLMEHHERRLLEVRTKIRENPGLDAYTLTGHMTWNIRASSWETFPLTQKWFAVGECTAHLDYLLARNEIRRELDKHGVYHYY